MVGPMLIGCVLIGELAALMAIFSPQTILMRLLFFLSAHTLSCTILATLLCAAFPSQHAVKRYIIFGFIFGISFFIPFFGPMGMLVSFLYFKYFLKSGSRAEFFTVSLPPFMVEAGGPGPGMGEGGAWSRLKAASIPRDMRLKALLAVSASSGLNASRLLQLASGDSDDEIRLLAFNLYERREKLISNTISQTLHALRETDNPDKRRDLYRNLAFSYWEVVYNDLARDELAEFFISQSLDYAQKAMGLGEEDPALHILVGRLFLKQGDIEKAEKAIQTALDQGIHRDRVIPYLAELAFRRRNYSELKRYFQADPLLRHKPGIGPVVKFWMR
jgi:polysaccharide biosynthesis protein PelE